VSKPEPKEMAKPTPKASGMKAPTTATRTIATPSRPQSRMQTKEPVKKEEKKNPEIKRTSTRLPNQAPGMKTVEEDEVDEIYNE